jgi:hypothetical protein
MFSRLRVFGGKGRRATDGGEACLVTTGDGGSGVR